MRVFNTLLILILIVCCANAAITSATQFEVRTAAGSATNGGGFDSTMSGAGTDMSVFDNKNASGCTSCQSSSANLSTTDAVTAGTTTVTSPTANFTSALKANVINIAGSWFQVTAVGSATSITVDRVTGSGSGVTMNIGGALTLAAVVSAYAAGNKVWVKNDGTYTVTTANALPGGLSVNFEGYTSSRGDNGKMIITTSTNSTQLFTGTTLTFVTFKNLTSSNTAGTRGDFFRSVGNYPSIWLINASLDGFNKAINCDNGSSTSICNAVFFQNVECKNSAVACVAMYQFAVSCQTCYFHDNTEDAIHTLNVNNSVFVADSVFANNGRSAIKGDGAATQIFVNNSVFYGNGNTFSGHPFSAIDGGTPSQLMVTNTAFYSGPSASTYINGVIYTVGRSNAYDAIPIGGSFYVSQGDVSLSADPFTNAAGGDYSLGTNSAALSLKTAGFPGTMAAGTGSIAIGALNSAASAAATCVCSIGR